MATEAYYQKKIIERMIANGGTAVTGTLKTGEADIQGSLPMSLKTRKGMAFVDTTILATVIVEVKTPFNYDRIMRAVREENGFLLIFNEVPLKKHEKLQIYKLNEVRKRGGVAMIAHSYDQVKQRLEELGR